MKNYSKNAKLNRVLNEIRNQLLSIRDTENESLHEIKRYIDYLGFDPNHLDYFIYEHGLVLDYNYQIRDLYSPIGNDWLIPLMNKSLLPRQ